MPSAGLIPWIQSLFCNMNSPCLKTESKTEKFGQVSDPPQTFTDAQIKDFLKQNYSFEQFGDSELNGGRATTIDLTLENIIGDMKCVFDSMEFNNDAGTMEEHKSIYDFLFPENPFELNPQSQSNKNSGSNSQNQPDIFPKICEKEVLCNPVTLAQEFRKTEETKKFADRADVLSKILCEPAYVNNIKNKLDGIDTDLDKLLDSNTCSEGLQAAMRKSEDLDQQLGFDVTENLSKFLLPSVYAALEKDDLGGITNSTKITKNAQKLSNMLKSIKGTEEVCVLINKMEKERAEKLRRENLMKLKAQIPKMKLEDAAKMIQNSEFANEIKNELSDLVGNVGSSSNFDIDQLTSMAKGVDERMELIVDDEHSLDQTLDQVQNKLRQTRKLTETDKNSLLQKLDNFLTKQINALSREEDYTNTDEFKTKFISEKSFRRTVINNQICETQGMEVLASAVSAVRKINHQEAKNFVCAVLTSSSDTSKLQETLGLGPNGENGSTVGVIKKCTPHIRAFYEWKYNTTTEKVNFEGYLDAQKFTCGSAAIQDLSGGLGNLMKSIQDSRGSGFGLDSISEKMADEMNLAVDTENMVQEEGGKSLMPVDNTKGIKDKKACELLKKQELTTELEIGWSIVKPLLIGKIPYYPSNFMTDQIVKQASKHFMMLEDLKNLAIDWENKYSDNVKNWFQNSEELTCSRDLLKIDQLKIYLTESLIGTGISSEQIIEFLELDSNKDNNWKQVLEKVDLAMLTLREIIDCVDLDKFVGINPYTGKRFKNETEMFGYAEELAKNKELWAAIHFKFEPEVTTSYKSWDAAKEEWAKIDKISYTIRQTIDSVPATTSIAPGNWKPGPRNSPMVMMYINGGFLYLQDMIDHAVIDLSKMHHSEANSGTNGPTSEASDERLYGPDINAGSWVQMHPYPCYKNDNFLSTTGDTLPLLLTIAWIYSVAMLVKDIVQEKESRLKEVMRMMGMENFTHWLGWFILSISTLQVTVFILSLVLKFGKILPYSSIFMINLWLGSFCFSTICASFLMSCCFSKANIAAACSGIIYFALHLPYGLLENWDVYLGGASKRLWSLICSISFAYGCNAVGQLEMQGEGLQWHNLGYRTNSTRLSMGETIAYMWLDSFLYIVLVWYLENAFPGEFGVPRPWWFPFSISYWSEFFGFSKDKLVFNSNDIDKNNYGPGNPGIRAAEYGDMPFEKEPTELPLGATIQKLSKKYKGADKFAIEDLNINFYEGQITSFLGHNGAGKTTTMSIMCGLFPPSSGTVYVNGYDVRTQLEHIRQDLGFCPQHNVLFESLTVEEHIWFFAALKGQTNNHHMFQLELDQMLDDTGLLPKRDFLPHQLSGGMKRKLSVATAFVGGSKCVILDEPTAGVDPYARRGIWDLLTRYKKGKTVILCTHHMDEADLLGDRIAIMHSGRLKTIGGSHWLKCEYGDGFALTLVKENNYFSNSLSNLSNHGKSVNDDQMSQNMGHVGHVPVELNEQDRLISDKKTINAVQGFVPKLIQGENTLTELTLTLPFASRANNMFTRLFRYLDENMQELGLSSYGLRDTTLEQIFLRVTAKHGNNSNLGTHISMQGGNTSLAAYKKSLAQMKSDQAPKVEKMQGGQLLWQQFKYLFLRRWNNARRSRKGIFTQLVLPPLFVLLSLSMQYISILPAEPPVAVLNPELYENKILGHEKIHSFYANEKAFKSDLRVARNESDPYGIENWHYYFPDFKTNKNGVVDTFTEKCNNTEIGSTNILPKEDQTEYCIKSLIHDVDTEDDRNTCQEEQHYNVYHDSVDSAMTDLNCVNCSRSEGIMGHYLFGTGGDPMAKISMKSNLHDLYLAENGDIPDWIVKSEYYFKSERFGGITSNAKNNLAVDPEILSKYIEIVTKSDPDSKKELAKHYSNLVINKNANKAWFMNFGTHTSPAYLSAVHNGVLKQINKKMEIETINKPFEFRNNQINVDALSSAVMQSILAITVIFAMSVVPSSFVMFLIDERKSGSKHLENLAGVPPWLYWATNFVWDILNYTFSVVLVVILFMIFGDECFTGGEALGALISLLMIFGWAIIPMMYPFSFMFDVGSSAYVILRNFSGTKLRDVFVLQDAILSRTNKIASSPPIFFQFIPRPHDNNHYTNPTNAWTNDPLNQRFKQYPDTSLSSFPSLLSR